MSKAVTSKRTIDNPRVVPREEWIAARKELLAKEKNLTKQRDAINAERRQLPWVKVDKEYVFDAPGRQENAADLFEGRSQLIVYHFMFAPGVSNTYSLSTSPTAVAAVPRLSHLAAS